MDRRDRAGVAVLVCLGFIFLFAAHFLTSLGVKVLVDAFELAFPEPVEPPVEIPVEEERGGT